MTGRDHVPCGDYGVGVCQDDGDHGHPFDVTNEHDREQVAKLTEGICPTCVLPAQRTDDGFAYCECCKVEWAIRGTHVVVRFDMAAFLGATA